MASPDEIRQNVSDAFLRFMTQREFDLAHRLYHPDYVNHEAASERSHGRMKGHRRLHMLAREAPRSQTVSVTPGLPWRSETGRLPR